jgi:hypothetical protein
VKSHAELKKEEKENGNRFGASHADSFVVVVCVLLFAFEFEIPSGKLPEKRSGKVYSCTSFMYIEYVLYWYVFRAIIHPIRNKTCTPELVSTRPLISPTCKPKAAFSKAGCIFLRPKNPKSPPRLAELQSDSVRANSSNVAC